MNKTQIKASWIIEQVKTGNYDIDRVSDCNCEFVWGNDDTGRMGLNPYQLQCLVNSQECWLVNKLAIDGIDIGEYIQYEGFNLFGDVEIIYDITDYYGNEIDNWQDIIELLCTDFELELSLDDDNNTTHDNRYISSLEDFLTACVDDGLKMYYSKGDFANIGQLVICKDLDNLPAEVDISDDNAEIDVDTFVEFWQDNDYALYIA